MHTFDALAVRDSAFCSNLANVSEIGHLDDPLNEMETHWTENINETIAHDQTVNILAEKTRYASKT